MKVITVLLFVITLTISSATHITANRNEAPMSQGSVTGLHNEKYGSGVQGSHFIVNERFTNISNNMAKTIGIPEQYGLIEGDDIESFNAATRSRQSQERLSSTQAVRSTGVSFSQMSSQINGGSSTRQRTRIQLYNN